MGQNTLNGNDFELRWMSLTFLTYTCVYYAGNLQMYVTFTRHNWRLYFIQVRRQRQDFVELKCFLHHSNLPSKQIWYCR